MEALQEGLQRRSSCALLLLVTLPFLALACAVAARLLAERHVYGAPAAPTQQDVVFHGPPGTRLCWVPSESAVADLGACYEIGADRERRISSWPGHALVAL